MAGIDGDGHRGLVAERQAGDPADLAVAIGNEPLHLRHGVWSMFQTLGVSHPRYIRIAHVGAWIFSAIIVVGNISFPLAVLAGIVR